MVEPAGIEHADIASCSSRGNACSPSTFAIAHCSPTPHPAAENLREYSLKLPEVASSILMLSAFSLQLSAAFMVEPAGIEPATSALQRRCSPS